MKDSLVQCNDVINIEVDHNYNEDQQIETHLALKECIQAETPPSSLEDTQECQENEKLKNDTMGEDITDIISEPEPEESTSANDQGMFSACIPDFGNILNYYSNITQESWKVGLDDINSI
ncbi:hypothetical protein O181_024456 [Austropuccinia psidii MF-1]|uniref:Uncharacterized protein n=1 Tax=Austropuccinia psidii MF-1 TaxID=1389203 RepID=A0A9Q3CGS6_9BASI|nr:hypothetical protein [Austropuccinia psidii MF-1]